MSHPDGLKIARRRIAQERERRTGTLDLGQLGLTEWPAELWELEHLEALNLGDYYRPAGEFEENRFPEDEARWERLSRLRRLDLDNPPGVRWLTDLEPLAVLRKLRELKICWSGVARLDPLAELGELTALDCSITHVTRLDPLGGLRNLTALDCSRTPVAQLDPLRALTGLTSLICHSTQVSRLDPLAGLVHLTALDCARTPVAQLEPLAALARLAWLDCSETQVARLDPLAGLAQLASLSCWGTRVTSLAPLATLPQLTRLTCDGEAIQDSPADSPWLERLKGLRAAAGPSHCLEPLRAHLRIYDDGSSN